MTNTMPADSNGKNKTHTSNHKPTFLLIDFSVRYLKLNLDIYFLFLVFSIQLFCQVTTI